MTDNARDFDNTTSVPLETEEVAEVPDIDYLMDRDGNVVGQIVDGKVQDLHVLALVKPKDDSEGPVVACTCGWVEGPSQSLLKLGVAAKDHSIETGHLMRNHG